MYDSPPRRRFTVIHAIWLLALMLGAALAIAILLDVRDIDDARAMMQVSAARYGMADYSSCNSARSADVRALEECYAKVIWWADQKQSMNDRHAELQAKSDELFGKMMLYGGDTVKSENDALEKEIADYEKEAAALNSQFTAFVADLRMHGLGDMFDGSLDDARAKAEAELARSRQR